MTIPLTHEEAFNSLGAAVIDALDASERDAVLAHVESCDECRTEFDALRAVAGDLALVAPTVKARPASQADIRDRLLARATAEGQAKRMANPPLVFPKGRGRRTPARAEFGQPQFGPPPVVSQPTSYWVAIAASVAFVAALIGLGFVWQQGREARETLASVQGSGVRTRDSLVTEIQKRDSVITGLANRDVTMFTLTSRTATKEPYGRVFWDRTHDTWTMFARNMPALKPGRTYQMWVVTAKGPVSAGTFEPQDGGAYVRATYAVTPENLRAVAVTEEPAGGVPQPTGEMIIAVNAGR